jgi:hypothetical protein
MLRLKHASPIVVPTVFRSLNDLSMSVLSNETLAPIPLEPFSIVALILQNWFADSVQERHSCRTVNLNLEPPLLPPCGNERAAQHLD